MVNNRNNGKRRVKNRKRIGLTQQASVRRGPRASATSLLTVARRRSKHLFAEGPVPRLPSFSRLLTQQASVRRGPRASATSLLTVARTDAASICSPRAPCLGYLASHGCANRRSKHLFAEGPVPRLPRFSRLREQTQQASVRRGPRASAT